MQHDKAAAPGKESYSTGNIRGRIRTRAGAPVPEVTILVTGSGAVPDIAPISNEKGEFALDGLAEGEYSVDGQRVRIVRGETVWVELVVD